MLNFRQLIALSDQSALHIGRSTVSWYSRCYSKVQIFVDKTTEQRSYYQCSGSDFQIIEYERIYTQCEYNSDKYIVLKCARKALFTLDGVVVIYVKLFLRNRHVGSGVTRNLKIMCAQYLQIFVYQ